jgi:FkbM family methyltransferase
MKNKSVSLTEILDLQLNINIVDLGASDISEHKQPVYYKLLEDGNAKVIGFEPNPEALASLNQKKADYEIYLPDVIADGGKHMYNFCYAGGMNSILEPDFELFNYFQGFSRWAKINSKTEVQTKCLDDIALVQDIDLYKMDIQGAELMALKHSAKKIEECLVIHAEVSFLPLYKNQPLFTDIDLFLREKGFILHNFLDIQRRMISPLSVPKDVYAGLNQVIWADAVFIKDFTKLEKLAKEKLLKYCVIMHDVYGSYDLVMRSLIYYDENYGTAYSNKYYSVS